MGALKNIARKVYAPVLGGFIQGRRRAATTEDYDAHAKMERSVDRIPEFGGADFADLATWIFASSLTNHRVIHQRIDEGSLLWRAVKMSGGPILELGRAAGGSTIVLLGASGERAVVSVDRAPAHSFISQRIFDRPDVARRLKLYRQSTREPIAETAFGMMFVDGDHSYDGVCHDIATFWNRLQSFDRKPPIAAFHDAADNPISYVEPVRRACLELLAEPGAARIVENWGSMLVLEKTGAIDPARWYGKEDEGFWADYAEKGVAKRSSSAPGGTGLRLGAVNLLGEENVDEGTWIRRGVTVEPVGKFGADNPLRLLRETRDKSEHGIAKTVPIDGKAVCFSVFLRPCRADTVRLSIGVAGGELIHADFDLGVEPKIGATAAAKGHAIAGAGLDYRNGYFQCELGLRPAAPVPAATFAVSLLDAAGHAVEYPGRKERGLFVNLSSVREIV